MHSRYCFSRFDVILYPKMADMRTSYGQILLLHSKRADIKACYHSDVHLLSAKFYAQDYSYCMNILSVFNNSKNERVLART